MSRRTSSPELIRRAAEVAALASARRGRGRLVLAESGAGIGKTRLIGMNRFWLLGSGALGGISSAAHQRDTTLRPGGRASGDQLGTRLTVSGERDAYHDQKASTED